MNDAERIVLGIPGLSGEEAREMFSRNEKMPESTTVSAPTPSPAPAKPAASRTGDKASVISADLEVLGDLKSAGDVQIDGRVKGDIHSRGVTVSVGANIEGSIFAQSVQISGRVQGQVEASKVAILRNAEVFGDVLHETLEIESGAQFQGACRRLEGGPGQIKSPSSKPAA